MQGRIVSYNRQTGQRDIINRIRSNNDVSYMRTGYRPLALVETYGCQQNEADSEKIAGILETMGYDFTACREEADLIVLNTCCVRESAEQRLLGNIGALKGLKKRKPELLIGVCGCMMQQEHIVELIKSKYKHVDMVFGTHTLYKFPEILQRAMDERERIIEVEDCEGNIFEGYPVRREDKNKAWVSIMYGCNNFCSYCVVPYVRGRERSRRPEDIISEIIELAGKGFKEVTLLGQNVNSYGKDLGEDVDFADLLEKVNGIRGIKRIRFMTSHPKDISDKLIDVMANCENVCPHLHLPVQSGSDKVLKDMNRKYTCEKYLKIIDRVREKIPGIAITSDIIVGFPTETQQDFEQTLELVKKVEFDSLFTFIYSPRKGTAAEKLGPVLGEEAVKRNFERLNEVQNDISLRINKGYVGKTVEVMVEGRSKTNPDVLTGRTGTAKIVNFKGEDDLVGRIINIEITGAQTWTLSGNRCSPKTESNK